MESSTGKIFTKMVAIMQGIGAISKDQTNNQGSFGYKFRGIDQFMSALYPQLCRHGVFLCPRVIEKTSEIRDVIRSNGKPGCDKHVNLTIEYKFIADDGSFVVIGPIVSEGLDSGDKATNKALSAALKYCLMQTFSVPTEDIEDSDKHTPEISRVVYNSYQKKNKGVEVIPEKTDTQSMATSTPKISSDEEQKLVFDILAAVDGCKDFAVLDRYRNVAKKKGLSEDSLKIVLTAMEKKESLLRIPVENNNTDATIE